MADTLPPKPSFRSGRLSPRRQYVLLGWIVAGLIAVVVLGSAIAKMLHKEPALPPSDPPGLFTPTADQLKSFGIERIGVSGLGSLVTATGQIAADGDLSTPVLLPYSGQVVKVLADAGQVVSKGQPLLIVRTGDFVDARNALYGADANLRAAQAQLLNAQRNAERQKLIATSAGGAAKDYQQAQADLAAAQAQERSAEAALGAARDKLAIYGKSEGDIRDIEGRHGIAGLNEQTTLVAPIGGTVATRDVSPGQFISAGGDKPVFTITDPSRVWLIAQIAETEASAVHVGDSAEVTTPAYPGRTFQAKIETVGAALDPLTHRLPVRASIANPDKALKPQMFASFAIRHTAKTENGASPRLYVPATAVIHEGDTARIWVLRDDNKLQAREVKTGDSQNGQVEITEGLKPGERIVTSGAIFVNQAGLGA